MKKVLIVINSAKFFISHRIQIAVEAKKQGFDVEVALPYISEDHKIILESEKKISGFGRLLVRKSGTEKLIRIMVEAEDAAVIDATMSPVVTAIKEL